MVISSKLIRAKEKLGIRLSKMPVTTSLPDDITLYPAKFTSGGIENIRGIGIGFREVGSKLTNEVSVRVFVAHKLPEDSIQAKCRIPSSMDGFPIDVEEFGYDLRFANCCLIDCGDGSPFQFAAFGAKAKTKNRQPVLLGTNHALAMYNELPIGTVFSDPESKAKRRPKVGNLYDFVPLEFGNCYFDPLLQKPNSVDAALVAIPLSIDHSKFEVPDLTGPLESEVLTMPVKKKGPVTGNTIGIITDVLVDVIVPASIKGLRRGIQFTQQIRIRGLGGAFSTDGDSGSLVLNANTGHAVGLLHACDLKGVTIASPIRTVVKQLGLSI